MPYSKNSIAQKDFYEYYKQSSIKKNKEYVDYKTHSSILKEANKLIRDEIIYNGERFLLPYRGGELFIHKYENVFKEENKSKWKVDWKKTKEVGFKVYFDSKYGYKWKWDKRKAVVKGKKFYTFRACRKSQRMVSDAINNKNVDYYQ
jgi:hypothetical protein